MNDWDAPLRGDTVLLVAGGTLLNRAAVVVRTMITYEKKYHMVDTLHHGHLTVESTADPWVWVAEFDPNSN
jgi:hypothetical protein